MNQEMSDAEAAALYTRVGRVSFDGTGDAMDFINTIEAKTRTGYCRRRGLARAQVYCDRDTV